MSSPISQSKLSSIIALWLTREATTGGLTKSFKAIASLMKRDTRFKGVLTKLASCTPKHFCFHKFCPTCSLKKDDPEQRSREIRQAERNSRSRNPRVSGRQEVQPFLLFPPEHVYWITVNLEAVLSANLLKRVLAWRKEIYRRLKPLRPNLTFFGRQEFKPKLAEKIDPAVLSDPASLLQMPPVAPVFLLHFHALVYVNGASRETVRDFFVEQFGGGNVVNVRSIKDRISINGINDMGVEGLGFYMSKEFVDLAELPGVAPSDLLDVLDAFEQVNRKNTSLKINLNRQVTPEVRSWGRATAALRQQYPEMRSLDPNEIEAEMALAQMFDELEDGTDDSGPVDWKSHGDEYDHEEPDQDTCYLALNMSDLESPLSASVIDVSDLMSDDEESHITHDQPQSSSPSPDAVISNDNSTECLITGVSPDRATERPFRQT